MAYKLLLADDSITIQKVVELVLAEEDFQIKSVSNGEDALKVFADFQPDIVLADIEMPKMNGYQLCDKIKKNPETKHVPVILLAGAFEPLDAELSANVGADDSVIKPFESQELISKINAVLTMGGVAAAEEVVEAEEEVEAVGEADFEVAEAEGEPVAAEEEDLWAMDEVTGTAEPAALIEEEIGEPGEAVAMEIEEEAFGEAEPAVFGEAAALEEEAVEIAPEPEPTPVSQFRPAEAASPLVQPAAPAAAQVALSQDEIITVFRASVDQQVAKALAGLDLKATISAALVPMLKETVEKVLWEIAPELTDKALKEILKGTTISLGSQVEKVLWETVPDLASAMIAKEIERIKSEF
ncbi:MAG: response regulator [Thermodesulfovibrionales bacterium]